MVPLHWKVTLPENKNYVSDVNEILLIIKLECKL